jgi:hypothetical protein
VGVVLGGSGIDIMEAPRVEVKVALEFGFDSLDFALSIVFQLMLLFEVTVVHWLAVQHAPGVIRTFFFRGHFYFFLIFDFHLQSMHFTDQRSLAIHGTGLFDREIIIFVISNEARFPGLILPFFGCRNFR